MPHRTFNLNEVTEYLHLPREDIELLVRRHEIPFAKQGGRLIFRKNEIDAWASQRILGLTDKRLADYHKLISARRHDLSQRHAIMPELLRADYINPVLESRTKPAIMRDMVALAERTGLLINPTDLLQSLKEREEMCSTALADGIALLHPRHRDPYVFEDSFVVLSRACQPIPFGALDGQLTDIFFLICCQDDRIHLHALARICLMCKNTGMLAGIRAGADAAEIYAVVLRSEEEVIKTL